jgi:hypothetical protein
MELSLRSQSSDLNDLIGLIKIKATGIATDPTNTIPIFFILKIRLDFSALFANSSDNPTPTNIYNIKYCPLVGQIRMNGIMPPNRIKAMPKIFKPIVCFKLILVYNVIY